MRADLFEGGTAEVLGDVLGGVEGELLVVNPSRETTRELVSMPREEASATIRLFVDEQPLKRLLEDFLVASSVADMVAEGTLAVRMLDPVPRNSLVLTEESVVSLVERDAAVAGLETADASFVAETYGYYDGLWDRAEPFPLRTPALSQIRETLEADLGPDAVRDFDRVLATLETARGDGDGLDEVTIALLVAAKNRELLYDVSRWGEDIGLASKATFSRVKNRLEDQGLLETEKVPIDVGRPRLRLMLTPRASGEIEDVVAYAQAHLGG